MTNFKNINAEKYIICEMISNSDSIPDIIVDIKKDDFYDVTHKELFDYIIKIKNSNRTVDLLELSQLSIFVDDITGIEYLNNLINTYKYSDSIENSIRIVKDKSILRKLFLGAKKIQSVLMNIKDDENINNIKADCMSYVDVEVNENDDISIRDIAIETVEMISKRCERKATKQDIKYRYGYKWLDKITAGVHGGELTVLAATPGTGKTAFAINVIANMAFHDNHIAVFSIEMSSTAICERMLLKRSGVDGTKTRSGNADENDFISLLEAAGDLGETSIHMYNKNNIEYIRAKCRQLKNRNKLDFICIDYLQLIDCSKSYQTENSKYSYITRELKVMAQEMNVPILLLCQLNRNIYQRQCKRPNKGDLRDSGAIEQNADNIIFLWSDLEEEQLQENNEIEIICTIDKQRNGIAGVEKPFVFIKNTQDIQEIGGK